MSEKRTRRGRGPDLRPRRSRARIAGANVDADSSQSQQNALEDLPIEIDRLYLLDDRLVQVKRRTVDGRVVVIDQDDSSERRVPPGELRPRASDTGCAASPERDALPPGDLTEQQQAESLRRLDLIRPLLDPAKRSEHHAKSLARKAGMSARTLYRWLGAYLEGGLRALAPAARGLSHGAVLLDSRVEDVIEKTILEAFSAGESSVTVLGLLPSIVAACEALPPGADGERVSPPGRATIQRRLSQLRKDHRNHKGEVRRILREAKQPVTGSIDAHRALEIIEIDHTVMDVHAVDAETLEPIGRPTFTVAIDDFTRCVMGFVLTLLPPCALAAALCLQRMRFPKEPWLKQVGLEVEWPMYGAPEIIQTDHAKEFVAPGFRYGCERLGAQARTRLIASPRYGGTVERLIGTLMRKFRLLPGASYNDMLRKAMRRPVRDACYTLAALEWEVVREIALYHDTRHRALGMTPRQAWDRAMALRGWVAPPLPTVSPELCVIDFLPRIQRKVGREGIEYHQRFYWAEELRPLIATDTHIFVRPDPRNVRHLWLQLPEVGYVRSNLFKPRDFDGVTEWDWRAWWSRRRGAPVLNHAVHAQLLAESRARRAEAATQVRAHRNTAKTVLQTRRKAAQNRLFQHEALAKGEFDLSRLTDASQLSHAAAEAHTRPSLVLIDTRPAGPDLSKLKPTQAFVYRRGRRT